MRPSKETPRQDKRSLSGRFPLDKRLRGLVVLLRVSLRPKRTGKLTHKQHSSNVVHVPLFPSSCTDRISRSGNFGTIEYGRLHVSVPPYIPGGTYLIHVIPYEQEGCRFLLLSVHVEGRDCVKYLPNAEIKHLSPPIPALGIEEVHPNTVTCPAVPLKVGPICILDQNVKVSGVGVNPKGVRSLDMRIYDCDHLPLSESYLFSF